MDMSDQQATYLHTIQSKTQVSRNNISLQTELLSTCVAKEMLELTAASTSHPSHVTIATMEPCAASTSQLDDVLYEHITTYVEYEHCHNHYSLLSNTDYLHYDSLHVTTSSTTSDQYTELFNNRHVTGGGDQSSVSTATGRQNERSITSQPPAPATAELPDDVDATTLV